LGRGTPPSNFCEKDIINQLQYQAKKNGLVIEVEYMKHHKEWHFIGMIITHIAETESIESINLGMIKAVGIVL